MPSGLVPADSHDQPRFPRPCWRLQDVQPPLIAGILIGGAPPSSAGWCASGSIDAALGPTQLFPVRLRRPVAMVMCAIEMALALGCWLILYLRSESAPDGAVRARQRPCGSDRGCCVPRRHLRAGRAAGAPGPTWAAAASVTSARPPVGGRVAGRSAAARRGRADLRSRARPCSLPPRGAAALLFARDRRGRDGRWSPPCRRRSARRWSGSATRTRASCGPLPAERTLAALHRSSHWRRHVQALITAAGPVDMWRELCWRYVVYPGELHGRPVELVFAVFHASAPPGHPGRARRCGHGQRPAVAAGIAAALRRSRPGPVARSRWCPGSRCGAGFRRADRPRPRDTCPAPG